MSDKTRPRGLPSKFKFIQVEGEGSFGKVVKCIDIETLHFVAIKMPKWWSKHTKNELAILEKNMSHNLDKCNIVKYIECFPTFFGKALVFESLDISLCHFMFLHNCDPMSLSDIRTIIQQLATAFDGLKEIGVIHTDVKSDNIMLVNHYRRPFEVKLIDFGLAIPTSDAEKFRGRQLIDVIAPESFLGAELNEAMDMWALGCVLFQMFAGQLPFRENDEYGMVSRMVELLGMPSNHLLTKCKKAGTYFTKTSTGDWRIKSPVEYYKRPPKTRWRPFKCLDDLRTTRRGKDNRTAAVEQRQCIELLKAMMAFDADERITPSEVLNHPFITKVYPKVQTSIKSCASKPPAAPLNNKARSNIRPGDCTPSPEILATAKILVRPVTAKNATLLEGQESAVSEPTAAPLKDEASSNIRLGDCTPSPEILTTAEISVRPVSAENTTLLEGQESAVSEPTAAPLEDEASSNIRLGDCTPSPEILTTAEISVRPVSAENTKLLEGQESTVSEPTAAPLEDEASSNIRLGDCTPSPDILTTAEISVRPVTAENATLLEGQESAVSEPTAAPLKDEASSNIRLGDCTPSPEILTTAEISVRPVTAENTTLPDDQEIPVSFESGLNKTSESSVSNADSNRTISVDSTTCEDTGPKAKGKKKKKKNCFRRLVSWLRKTFCCCVSCDDVD